MKAVLISVQPNWCEKICHKIGVNADGTPIYEKRVEVRKKKPKLETPFKVYIYCTKSKGEALWKYRGEYYYDTQFPNERPNKANGKVIGEFVCDFIRTEKEVACGLVDAILANASCVNVKDLIKYANGNFLYSWHISNLVIYDKPKELSEFRKPCDYDLGCKCCSMYFPGTMFAEPYCKNGDLEITRTPQSWCYVEEKG